MAHRLWPMPMPENSVARPGGVFEAQLPFYETGGYMDRYQRIEEISREQGFLPVTKPEQVEAMGLQSFDPKIGGAAKHIAEVVKKQIRTNMDDPMRTARKLTRNYIDYAKDANISSRELTQLSEAIEEANPELVMDRVIAPEQPGLRKFLRFYDLSILRDTKSFKSIGYDPQLVDYGEENGGLIFYIGEAIASWRVHQVRRRLPEARDAEANRFIFWTSKLTELDKGYPALRSIVRQGLDEIYGRKSEN